MKHQLSGSSVSCLAIKATEIKPQTRNLPQDIIIKVGRGGISNQGGGFKKIKNKPKKTKGGREHNTF